MDDIIPQFKVCFTCKTAKPATKDFFHVDRHCPDGLISCCKVCRNARTRKAPFPPLKQCSKCKEYLPSTTDYFRKHSVGGLQPRCKKCLAQDDKSYQDTHIEEHKQYYQERKEEISKKR